MIDATMRTAATTVTTGAWLGRARFAKIHNGRVCTLAPAVNVVTMISSKDSANASRRAGEQGRPDGGKVT